jgi:DNA polymerase elongation subunit (family B)
MLGAVALFFSEMFVDTISFSLSFTSVIFAKYLKEEKVAISKSKHLFTQKEKGLMPEFLENLYTKRKNMKNCVEEMNISHTLSQ